MPSRYVNWRTDTMQTDSSRAEIREFSATGDNVRALHDASHPEHRQANADYLMCLDKGDIVSRYLLLEQQAESEARNLRETYEFQLRQLSELTTAARAWWAHCIRSKHAGRKTVRTEDMPTIGER